MSPTQPDSIAIKSPEDLRRELARNRRRQRRRERRERLMQTNPDALSARRQLRNDRRRLQQRTTNLQRGIAQTATALKSLMDVEKILEIIPTLDARLTKLEVDFKGLASWTQLLDKRLEANSNGASQSGGSGGGNNNAATRDVPQSKKRKFRKD